MNFNITLFVRCQLTYRDTIGAMIRHICSRLEEQGESKNFGHQVISAFNEAFNNLARHGGGDVENQEVVINLAVTDEQLIIEMEDDAVSFHPPKEIPPIKNARESGMGLLIIKEFMDSHKYKRKSKNGVNSLIMVRNLSITPRYA